MYLESLSDMQNADSTCTVLKGECMRKYQDTTFCVEYKIGNEIGCVVQSFMS